MNLNEIVETYNCKREAFILILNSLSGTYPQTDLQ